MTKSNNRKPETLFGSGQKNANRKGRVKAVLPTMSEIMAKTTSRKLKSGKTIRQSLNDDVLTRTFVDAMKGDRHALREIIDELYAEKREEITRRKDVPTGKKYKELLDLARQAIQNHISPELVLLKRLESADVVYRLSDGEYFIRPWAIAAAAEARGVRIGARRLPN